MTLADGAMIGVGWVVITAAAFAAAKLVRLLGRLIRRSRRWTGRRQK